MNTFAGLVVELHAFQTTAVGGVKCSSPYVLLVRGLDGPQGWSLPCKCMSLLWPEMEPWFSGHGARGLQSILTDLRLLFWFESRMGHTKPLLKVYVVLLSFLIRIVTQPFSLPPSRYLAVISDSYTGAYEDRLRVRCEFCLWILFAAAQYEETEFQSVSLLFRM